MPIEKGGLLVRIGVDDGNRSNLSVTLISYDRPGLVRAISACTWSSVGGLRGSITWRRSTITRSRRAISGSWGTISGSWGAIRRGRSAVTGRRGCIAGLRSAVRWLGSTIGSWSRCTIGSWSRCAIGSRRCTVRWSGNRHAICRLSDRFGSSDSVRQVLLYLEVKNQ